MEQLKAFFAQIQSSDNPLLFYILGAVALLVAFMVLRSLLATAILIAGAVVAVLVIFLVLGKPLPKVDFSTFKFPDMPDISKLLPKGGEDPEPASSSPDTQDITIPDVPGVTPSSDPLKDSILEDRHNRSKRGFGFGF